LQAVRLLSIRNGSLHLNWKVAFAKASLLLTKHSCWLRLNLWANTQQSNYSEGNVGAGAQPCWVAASSAPGTKYSKRRERFALFSPFTSCSENIYRDRGLQLSAVEVLCSAGEGWRCWSKVRDSMQGAQWGWQSQRGWKAKMYMLMQQRRERANNPGK